MQKQLYISFCTIFFFLGCNTKANDLTSIIGFADSLSQNKDFSTALHEYQRALFFAESEYRCPLSEKIANCHFILGNYKMARVFYDSAIHYSCCLENQILFSLQKVLSYIMEENYGYALLKLDTLEVKGFDYLERKKNFYKGICYFGMEQYDICHGYILSSISESDTLGLFHLNSLFAESRKLSRPNPVLATILSIVLPGSGQLYSGEIKDGLNSLLLVGGLFYLGIANTLIHPLATIPITYRYYMGGIVNAKQAAEQKRKENKLEYFTKMKEVISCDQNYLELLFTPAIHSSDHSLYLKKADSELNLIISFSFLLYKEFISSQDVEACVFYPSCSEYTIQAVENRGAIIGMLDGFDRLLRCHTFVNEKDYEYDWITQKYHDPH